MPKGQAPENSCGPRWILLLQLLSLSAHHSTSPGSMQPQKSANICFADKTKPRLAASTISAAPRLPPSCAASHVSNMPPENARPMPHPPILFPHLLRNGKVHDQNRNSHDAASSNWLHAADSTCHALTSWGSSSLASACAMQRSKRSMTPGLPQTIQASHRKPPTASASWPTAAA